MSLPANIHDAFFKQVMSDPETAACFLRERLPAGMAALLGPGLPEPLPGSFVDETLGQHHTDMLFRLPLASGEEALLYVLVEHKGAPDPQVPLQLLRYLSRLWGSLDGRPLPPVIPLVVYHGARRWTVPTAFSALFGAPPAVLRPHLPVFDYVLVDLGVIEDEALSRQARLRTFLKAMKYILRRTCLSASTGCWPMRRRCRSWTWCWC